MARRGRQPCKTVSAPSRSSVSHIKLPEMNIERSCVKPDSILSGNRFCHGIDPETVQRWEETLRDEASGLPAIGSKTADIRTVWEPARLQHLTVLLAYLAQGNPVNGADELESFVKGELLGWLDANPFLSGLHYSSAMECGLRIPLFVYSLRLLSRIDDNFWQLVSRSICQHAKRIENNLSLYSSRGNHTVCEASGLVFAGVFYRETKDGIRWLNLGIDLLKHELKEQVLPDGGPLEQSFAYHRFVLDLYWLTVDFLERNNICDCQDMRPTLLEAERFITFVTDSEGHLPSVGDSDGGYAIAPGISPNRGFNEKTGAPPACHTFSDSGYTVFRGGEDEFLMLFDHSPLGMPPLYNHGHADALSVTLSLGGYELLVDPGTFRYNGAPFYRSYFRGTSAHNTVVVDQLDQAEQVTGFIWKAPFSCQVTKNEFEDGRYIVQAEHTGYRRLRSPVTHRRMISYMPHKSLIIKDSFVGEGKHDFSIYFHIHPDATVSQDDSYWKIERSWGVIWIKLLDGHFFELIQGDEKLPMGWYSPDYGRKTTAPALCCHQSGNCHSVIFRTYININRNDYQLPQGVNI